MKNKCRCLKCNDVIESKHRHDFVRCKCGAIFTDGGYDYIRRGGELDMIEDIREEITIVTMLVNPDKEAMILARMLLAMEEADKEKEKKNGRTD